MKRNVFITLLLLMLFTASCSKDDGPPPSPNGVGQELKGLEGARQRLTKIVTQPEFRSLLVTEDNPMGLAVVMETTMYDRHGDMLTRADEDSALIYVFELEDGGVAVLGEPPHMPELLAFAAGDGPMIRDSLNFDPIGIIIGGSENDPIQFGDPTRNYHYDQAEYSYLNGYEPLRYEWNQRYGFNDYCNGNAAGCVPVAVALVMAHPTGRPYSYDGWVFNWTEMSNFGLEYNNGNPNGSAIGREHVNRLIEMVGRSRNLDANYGKYSTSASVNDAPRTFKNFGYSNGGKVSDYSFELVKSEIATNHPVIARAEYEKNESGHAWVISSIVEEKVPWTEYDPDTGLLARSGVETFYLVHCNWGWGGDRNGFYIKDCFDTNKGPKLDDDKIPVYDPQTRYYNFLYERKVVHGIRK